VLFNPIARFYFSLETWQILDLAAALVLVLSTFFVTVNKTERQSEE
jgi:hypothetical protein